MAKRDALRELQGRLAERLSRSKSEQAQRSWLAVECAGQGLLMPLATAGEIFNVGPVLPVPHTQPWFLGVANLRGGLHGVVDLAAFLGLRAPILPEAIREHFRLLAFNPAFGSHCAVLVDHLAGLRGAEQLSAEPPVAAPRPGFAGAVWRDTEGRAWQEIDLTALARHEQFLAIAA